MLPNKNTTISALLTVRYVSIGRDGETQQGVIVFENVYARRPLPLGILNGPYDARFGLDGNDLACVFCGPALGSG